MITRKYNNTNDCWEALRDCFTLSEMYGVIKTFPACFGEWEIEEDAHGVCLSNYLCGVWTVKGNVDVEIDTAIV